MANTPGRNNDLDQVDGAILFVLRLQVFGLEDAFGRVGGVAYDKQQRIYKGSRSGLQLNQNVDRFAGDPQAFEVDKPELSDYGGIFPAARHDP